MDQGASKVFMVVMAFSYAWALDLWPSAHIQPCKDKAKAC